MITGVTAKQNPFPGLRPFREDEERFFFGRERQVDTMVNKLASTRFLAVVGTSGSGKSSLVNCGLRPALHRGLMASAGPAWRMAQFRPGVDPIHSLAEALAAEGVLYSGHKEDVPIEEIVETYLRGSRKGVVETFRKARLPEGTNLLVVADQFEELFRYQKLGTPDGKEQYSISETAIAFVNLLLEASAQPDCPIYVVITMRSDFLGDCSQFYGLPEAINEGQYLVPRMTRDERRASIAGPVSVGGAKINPVLLTRLVNDVGDNPDQLSILQHALNRTWACWEFHGAEGELELEHYAEIGTMSEALNQHANEAFGQLETPERAKICEKLFKALTDLGTDPRGVRRPLKLATLSEIVGTGSEEDVKAVIELFREPSRAFLMPPAPEPLEPEKVIDISHESLMRVWERLRRWAEDEANSARRYRRLAETAALEKTGKARLWGDPDLQLALDWQEEQAPTPTWANLYGGDFESATAFLEKSRSERDHELAEVVFERRWSWARLVIILPTVGFALWSWDAGYLDWLLKWAQLVFPKNLKATLAAEGLQQAQTVAALRDLGKSLSDLNRGAAAHGSAFLLALTCFLGSYFLSYFALAYFGKLVFRRLAFAKILHKVAISSSKAVREQKLAEQAQALAEQAQALADPVDTLQMAYASFWRRLGAYVLALGLFIVGLVTFFVGLA
ncbi:MAG: ATP-binding protein, partial [Deltaproteobacteria bacterium]